MSTFDIVEPETWLQERLTLLQEEKELTARRDALVKRRRNMPVTRIASRYSFNDVSGTVGLVDLFSDCNQLVIYHFMFNADWIEGCKHCSFWADSFDGIEQHLEARDTAFVCVSNTKLDVLQSYKQRMGWQFRWVSTSSPNFGIDFGVSPSLETSSGYNYSGRPLTSEMPGLSTFVRSDEGEVFHSYSTYARGLEPLNITYAILDLTKRGRDEQNLPYPMDWVCRKDKYKDKYNESIQLGKNSYLSSFYHLYRPAGISRNAGHKARDFL